MEITYVNSPYAEKNPFLSVKAHKSVLPAYDSARSLLPEIVWEGKNETVACYNKAWELAFSNLNNPTDGSGFVSPFIDTAFNGNLFMWDSSFILMFAKYAARAFDFQQTLDNFYSHQHKDGFISREIREKDGAEVYARLDPSSTGPAVLAWCEYEYYLYAGDKSRLKDVYYPLLAYHMWMKKQRTWRDGTYFLSGLGCGMDNSPRQESGCNPRYEHGHMVWIDACFQALIDCDMLIKIAAIAGIGEGVSELQTEKETLGAYINSRLWDRKGLCRNRNLVGKLCARKSSARQLCQSGFCRLDGTGSDLHAHRICFRHPVQRAGQDRHLGHSLGRRIRRSKSVICQCDRLFFAQCGRFGRNQNQSPHYRKTRKRRENGHSHL